MIWLQWAGDDYPIWTSHSSEARAVEVATEKLRSGGLLWLVVNGERWDVDAG